MYKAKTLEVDSHGVPTKIDILGGSPDATLATEFKSWMAFLLFGADSASPKTRTQEPSPPQPAGLTLGLREAV